MRTISLAEAPWWGHLSSLARTEQPYKLHEGAQQLSSPTMPTCTLPFEIVFDFINDCPSPISLQVVRSPQTLSSISPTTVLQPYDRISLVLNAGTIYYYALERADRKTIVEYVARLHRACAHSQSWCPQGESLEGFPSFRGRHLRQAAWLLCDDLSIFTFRGYFHHRHIGEPASPGPGPADCWR